jgi:hypothetical protein
MVQLEDSGSPPTPINPRTIEREGVVHYGHAHDNRAGGYEVLELGRGHVGVPVHSGVAGVGDFAGGQADPGGGAVAAGVRFVRVGGFEGQPWWGGVCE